MSKFEELKSFVISKINKAEDEFKSASKLAVDAISSLPSKKRTYSNIHGRKKSTNVRNGIISREIFGENRLKILKNNIEEAAELYLMALTNDYIVLRLNATKIKTQKQTGYTDVLENIEANMEIDAKTFEKLGFDVHTLDEKIDLIDFNRIYYDAKEYQYYLWPSKEQEEVLKTVCRFFNCPIPVPRVSTIDEILEHFSVEFGGINSSITKNVSEKYTRVPRSDDLIFPFDAPFKSALKDGKSRVDLTIDAVLLDLFMSFYTIPNRKPNLPKDSRRIISVIPDLSVDIRPRVKEYYSLANYAASYDEAKKSETDFQRKIGIIFNK